MIILILITVCWLAIDICRYVMYRIMHHKFSKEKYAPMLNRANIKKILNDLRNCPGFLEDAIRNIYFNKVSLEDMNFVDVCKSIHEIVGKDPQHINAIKTLVKEYQIRERKTGNRKILQSNAIHPRIRDSNYSLKSWFHMLPLYISTRMANAITHIYMMILGYKHKVTKNGIHIWFSLYDDKKGTPLIFLHASIGGVVMILFLLRYYYKNYNIIIPEIPGISFVYTSDPPNVVDIVEDVYSFINCDYNNKCAIDKINIMGHSLGNTLCTAFIIKNPRLVDNFFCVEGQIFPQGALRIYSIMSANFKEIPYEDFFTVPLFQRNIYTQYYVIKKIPIDCVIFDLIDNPQLKIHMFHVKNDNKIRIYPQLNYAHHKSIHVSYHIFEKRYQHGAFVTRNDFQSYVLKKIQELYNR